MIKNTKKNLKNKKGFTLIELVVVIAVIGILAAIAIPRVTGITGKAKTEATKQHLSTLNVAVERYMATEGISDIIKTGAEASGQKLLGSDSVILNALTTGNYLNDDASLTLPNKKTATFDYTKDKFVQSNS